jgi:hypothetical protein
MGAELMAATGWGDGGMTYHIEHDVTRTMHGDLESVRARLSDALEPLGYSVLNESPLQARRSGTSTGANGCANDIRKFPTSLTIGLKSAGAHSTRATFAYVVKNPVGYLSRGDRATLDREAEAAIALAQSLHRGTDCASCGAELGGATRFCRHCGAPAVAVAPAELKVYQLTAETNSAYKWVYWSAVFIVLTAVLPLPLLLLGNVNPVKYAKLVKIVGFLCALFGAGGLSFLLTSLFRLRKIITISGAPDPIAILPRTSSSASPDTNELSPASASPSIAVNSITEGTTDLLPHEANRINNR